MNRQIGNIIVCVNKYAPSKILPGTEILSAGWGCWGAGIPVFHQQGAVNHQ